MTVCYFCGAKDTLADIGKELGDGKYKMVQCSKCKNAYYVVNKEKMNKPKPQTNEEYLRSCTTEQLAEFINYIAGQCSINKPCKLCTGWCHKDDVEKWLKQPHTIKE